jgi:hypothetical protein
MACYVKATQKYGYYILRELNYEDDKHSAGYYEEQKRAAVMEAYMNELNTMLNKKEEGRAHGNTSKNSRN